MNLVVLEKYEFEIRDESVSQTILAFANQQDTNAEKELIVLKVIAT